VNEREAQVIRTGSRRIRSVAVRATETSSGWDSFRLLAANGLWSLESERPYPLHPQEYRTKAFSDSEGFKTLEALQKWVEEGKTPNKIIYPHTKGGAMMGGRRVEVYRTHPVCPYPQQARYKGSADISDAANFECVNPDK